MYEFVGRRDQQVKIRGFRVELGEVETRLGQVPGVAAAAVVLRTDAGGHSELVAFWVASEPDQTLTARFLAGELGRFLPAYMIPARFELLAALPLTPNRKVDRKFLTEGRMEAIVGRREAKVLLPARVEVGSEGMSGRSIDGVLAEVRRIAGRILGVDAGEVEADRSLVEQGFDSIRFTSLSVALSRALEVEVDATLFYHRKTLREVAEHLCGSEGKELKGKGAAGRSTGGPEELRERLTSAMEGKAERAGSGAEPVAIIGMDVRLPGGADLDEFWRNLSAGVDAIIKTPAEREELVEGTSEGSAWGGYIRDIDKFDAPFFRISPREASAMDPRQRLFLESAWRAIEDAGYRPGALSGSDTGVYVGIVGGAEYEGEPEDDSVDSAAQLLVGSASSLIANRVSYHLNLRGPSAPVDTACSSSLVALHRAVMALQSGQCGLAIVGGVNLVLDPETSLAGQKTGMLSPDGRCKAFDSGADGYVRSEGVVAMLLKPLSRAIADGDSIYGKILGSAENHGGRAASLTVPNPEAQSGVIQAAWKRAGIDPRTLTYIETHGTGTQLGDPIEVNGLSMAWGGATRGEGDAGLKGGRCGLGSVKSNIGHLEAAAGLAGVAKVLLSMRHGVLPGNLHFRECNPRIRLEGSPFYIVDRTVDWGRAQDENGLPIPRRAGVSSFGFSGVNAHVVLEEQAPAEEPREGGRTESDSVASELILLSARTEERLRAVARGMLEHLERVRGTVEEPKLRDLAYTLQVGREAMAERVAFVVSDVGEACAVLRRILADQASGIFRGTDSSGTDRVTGGAAGADHVRELLELRDMEQSGRLWVAGGRIEWERLYEGEHRRRC